MGSQDDDTIFYHHICHFCKSSPDEPSEKFKKCSNCKLFAYCSVSHQKSDWKRHKPFCLTVKQILARMETDSLYNNDGDSMDPDTLYRYQCSVMRLVEINLQRKLSGAEHLSILYADLCGLCLRPNAIRVPCLNCTVEHYCSELHREQHSHIHAKDCANLNLCLALDFCTTFTRDLPNEPLEIVNDDSKTLKPFSVHMIAYLKEFYSEKCSEYDRLIMSDVLSYSLTLVYALKLAKTTDFKRKENLTVHIIGAEELEALIVKVLDPLFYWYPNLNSISLSLIGPQAPRSVEPFNRQGVTVEVTCCPELYHEFAKKSTYTKPDVALAFNCGFHEFHGSEKDTWKHTLVQLTKLNGGSLLVFTSYTEKESEKDYALVKNVDSERKLELLRHSVNPFASLKPYRNPERGETSTFFFNNYLSVFEIK